MENRLCPESPGPYLWGSALDGSVCSHRMSESEELINTKTGAKTSAKITDKK